MPRTLTSTEVRPLLLELAEQLNRPPAAEAATVTKRGKPVLALLPHEFYKSLVERLEVLGDETLMRSLRRSVKEARTGKTVPWEKGKKDLGL